jgi:hypothetical protein
MTKKSFGVFARSYNSDLRKDLLELLQGGFISEESAIQWLHEKLEDKTNDTNMYLVLPYYLKSSSDQK